MSLLLVGGRPHDHCCGDEAAEPTLGDRGRCDLSVISAVPTLGDRGRCDLSVISAVPTLGDRGRCVAQLPKPVATIVMESKEPIESSI